MVVEGWWLVDGGWFAIRDEMEQAHPPPINPPTIHHPPSTN